MCDKMKERKVHKLIFILLTNQSVFTIAAVASLTHNNQG